jgi:deoxyribodipyrimidine photolyase-related protein
VLPEIILFYPHQIFDNSLLITEKRTVVFVEDPLFFTQYPFHKQKLVLHRASMKAFEKRLKQKKIPTEYIEYSKLNDSEDIASILSIKGVKKVYMHDPVDNWLEKKIKKGLRKYSIEYKYVDSPNFVTSLSEGNSYFDSQKNYFFTSFYIWQRKRKEILLDKNNKPLGGKWTFDTENRKKLPKGHRPPVTITLKKTAFVLEAIKYVEKHFSDNPGSIENFNYPVTSEEAATWLMHFLEYRLHYFGDYEDAISTSESVLYHSMLTAPLNIGLLNPTDILSCVLEYEKKMNIPLNSLEGFIRQILGWREYIRLIYVREGSFQRTSNYWDNKRHIPASFWNGTSGIPPLDMVIKRVLDSAYSHHIERLMVVGNMMLLCGFLPDEIYEWFMALYIDSYDWVMVPNVYGMSQYADGGRITTKPYISSSNYILKMSDFKKGPWCDIWDGLYWKFIEERKEFFLSNPRMAIMPRQLEKMDNVKKNRLFSGSSKFLATLS